MTRSVADTIRELCLRLPDCDEVESHGSPHFRVSGKSFAIYAVNYHGDGRVALWVHSPEGLQQALVEAHPEYYFVPPYVGPKGWVGVELNKGLDWQVVAERVLEAWRNRAPRKLWSEAGSLEPIQPPDEDPRPEEIDPWLESEAAGLLERFRSICMALPETSEDLSFGNPVWKAGKKTFACAYMNRGRRKLQFRVGLEQQSFLVSEDRFSIPGYIGHNGWVDLDVEDEVNWAEVRALALQSYRHFALKRMLKALGE